MIRLAVFEVRFISPLFLPFSPTQSLTVVHDHVPPSTFSGLLFRAILAAHDERLVFGEYRETRPGHGWAVKLSTTGTGITSAEWVVKPKGPKEGYLPPYVEYHFRAASLGAYPTRILGEASKTWTMIKYIESAKIAAEMHVKTSIYGLMEAASICKTKPMLYAKELCPEGRAQGPNFYEVQPVKHLIVDRGYGYLLYDDPLVDRAVRRLAEGWFLAKMRMKNLVALRVIDIAKTSQEAEGKGEPLPSLSLDDIEDVPERSFSSFIVSPEALQGIRDDVSAIRVMLYQGTLRSYIAFKGHRSSYLVPSSWIYYLDYTGKGVRKG